MEIKIPIVEFYAKKIRIQRSRNPGNGEIILSATAKLFKKNSDCRPFFDILVKGHQNPRFSFFFNHLTAIFSHFVFFDIQKKKPCHNPGRTAWFLVHLEDGRTHYSSKKVILFFPVFLDEYMAVSA